MPRRFRPLSPVWTFVACRPRTIPTWSCSARSPRSSVRRRSSSCRRRRSRSSAASATPMRSGRPLRRDTHASAEVVDRARARRHGASGRDDATAHGWLAHRREAGRRARQVRELPALLAPLSRLGRAPRRHDIHRFRLRLLQGVRDLRRGVPRRCDRDGAGMMAQLLTGGEAVAHAMRQIDPDVVPVYPITPQTPIIQAFARFVADGRAHAELVDVESEHSAMSAAIGAALAGARTMTATSSQGLALMAEVVFIAASLRAPIVMALGNRALSGPINIHCDHSDSMLVRDSGMVQLFAENAQEAYDLTVLAPRLAEHPDVLLPVAICLDGFAITHAAEPVELLPDEVVRIFVGEYRLPHTLLDASRPATYGPFAMPDYYYELRRQQAAALGAALEVFDELAEELESLSGRVYSAVEAYRLDGAGRAIVALGSTAGTVKDVVDELRDEGESVGLLKVTSFRPLPRRAIAAALDGVERVVVLDRADSPGGVPPLAAEVAACIYGSGAELESHVYGLGGRDLHPTTIRELFAGNTPAY